MGDWTETADKLPNGIGKLTAEAKKQGVKFGIWIEPEMVLSDPVDSYYEARRNCGTVVSLGCLEPLRETCFCSVFGIDLAEPEGDVQAWVLGDEMYLNARTEKGEKLLSAVKDLCEETDGAPLAAAKDEARAKMAKNPLADLDLTGFDGEHMMEKFNAPEWKDLYQACLGCGTCTFVCPTCQCYDIRDFDTGHGIQRYRCWDSCICLLYTSPARCVCTTSRPTRPRARCPSSISPSFSPRLWA